MVMKYTRSLLVLTSLLMAVPACGSDTETESTSKKKKGGGGDEVVMAGTHGIVISQVAMYQGVKRVLMQNGEPVTSSVPIVPGRDSLVRIFYTADANYDGLPVQAELHIDGFEPLVQEVPVLTGSSTDQLLTSSVNFLVPGDHVGPTFTYQVKLLQEADAEDGGNPSALYPIASFESILAGTQSTLRIILAPFAYNADGSGRVPDLGPEMVEQYRQRFMQWYPVANVELAVRGVTPWSKVIDPGGSGWQEVMERIYAMRGQDGATDDTYYYGIFNPAPSLSSFCGFGCVLGLTFVIPQLPTETMPDLRFAAGVGYAEVARETAAHEIGHAHSRNHVNCSPAFQSPPEGIDPTYPYPGDQIGSWGWDMFTNTLIDPTTHTDFMGYCDENWVSDHTFTGLFARTQIIQSQISAKVMSGPQEKVEYEIIALDGNGTAIINDGVHAMRPVVGEAVEITSFDDHGLARQLTGQYMRWDHLSGGWLFVPVAGGKTDETRGASQMQRAEFVVDQEFLTVQR